MRGLRAGPAPPPASASIAGSSNNRCATFFNEPNSSTAVRFPCSLGQLPQQASLLDQLQQQMGDLQQEMACRPACVAAGIFQVQATVLLGVESLILRGASVPSRRGSLPPPRSCGSNPEKLPMTTRFSFPPCSSRGTQGVDGPGVTDTVRVVEAVNPAIDLPDLLRGRPLHTAAQGTTAATPGSLARRPAVRPC